MVKQIDLHLYKNQKQESRQGLSFNIYSNGNKGSSTLMAGSGKRSSMNTIQSTMSTAYKTTVHNDRSPTDTNVKLPRMSLKHRIEENQSTMEGDRDPYRIPSALDQVHQFLPESGRKSGMVLKQNLEQRLSPYSYKNSQQSAAYTTASLRPIGNNTAIGFGLQNTNMTLYPKKSLSKKII